MWATSRPRHSMVCVAGNGTVPKPGEATARVWTQEHQSATGSAQGKPGAETSKIRPIGCQTTPCPLQKEPADVSVIWHLFALLISSHLNVLSSHLFSHLLSSFWGRFSFSQLLISAPVCFSAALPNSSRLSQLIPLLSSSCLFPQNGCNSSFFRRYRVRGPQRHTQSLIGRHSGKPSASSLFFSFLIFLQCPSHLVSLPFIFCLNCSESSEPFSPILNSSRLFPIFFPTLLSYCWSQYFSIFSISELFSTFLSSSRSSLLVSSLLSSSQLSSFLVQNLLQSRLSVPEPKKSAILHLFSKADEEKQ